MEKTTGEKATMWGPSIVGFGTYHYKYDSGREGDMCMVGFSPRKPNLTLYLMGGFENYEKFMTKLGKYTTGSACLYIKKLEDVDINVLEQLIKESYGYVKKTYKQGK